MGVNSHVFFFSGKNAHPGNSLKLSALVQNFDFFYVDLILGLQLGGHLISGTSGGVAGGGGGGLREKTGSPRWAGPMTVVAITCI